MGGLHNHKNSENVRKSNKWYVYPGLHYWQARIEKLDQSLEKLSKEVDEDDKAEQARKEEEEAKAKKRAEEEAKKRAALEARKAQAEKEAKARIAAKKDAD
ncbi:hypothetical protein BP00DRAFT_444044 [Aspergillus indologenus CBS 114.80]|uniref:Uncharacterized protein n=1 Tax=Aspergillus indologenus CBS 114.80 TaxID=1450541 RepID=A0A2V5IIN6_9EURO|nr:hypothetical protein BP00DRAFT_444044 [Aspergillus indologenus CBS 114.80]